MTVESLIPLAPLLILGLWSLLLAAIARFDVAVAPALHRGIGGLGALFAGAAAWTILGDPSLDAGVAALTDTLAIDHLASVGDLGIALALLLALAVDRGGRGQGARAALLTIAAAGSLVTIHAIDLLPMIAGLEIAGLAVAALVAAGPGGGGRGLRWLRAHGVISAVLLLGVALIVAATGVTRFAELSGRAAMIFTRWGASVAQASVDLLESGVPIPDALAGEARTRAVTAMAPAALFIPGMLLTLAALLARLGVAFGGRLRAEVSERASASANVLLEVGVRLAVTIALIRLFVSGLHVPRQVFAPYGWSTPAAAVAGITLVVAGVMAIRARSPRRWLAAQGLVSGGMITLSLSAAANFYAHAGLRSTGVVIVDHHQWGMTSGDAAIAAAIFLCVTQGLAIAGVHALLRALGVGPDGDRVALQGLLHRRRGLGVAAFALIAALVGAPPAAIFVARLDLVTAVLVDNNALLRVLVVVAALTMVAAAAAGLRLLVLLVERPAIGDETGDAAIDRPSAAVAVGLAIVAVIAGIVAGPLMRTCALASAGAGLGLGLQARADRVLALRRAGEVDPAAADAPSPGEENAVDQASP